MLGFIKRNFKDCPVSVNKTIRISNIRSILEYVFCVWEPHQQYRGNKTEKYRARLPYSSRTNMVLSTPFQNKK